MASKKNKICKNCKYSVRSDKSWVEYPNILTCTHPKFLQGYEFINYETMDSDGIWLEDDEGWAWIVGPEFGCIHFEGKHELPNCIYTAY